MKQIFYLLIYLTFLTPVMAQQEVEDTREKRDLEKVVKTTGNYLYGEAVHEKKKEAEKIAKTMLISEIKREALNRPDWQFADKLKADNVKTNVEQIALPRGSRYRVIAYIKKADVVAVFKTGGTTVVIDEGNGKQKGGNGTNPPKDTIVPPVPPIPSNNPILEAFLKAQNAKEAGALLTKYKKDGKLVYGKPGTDPAPEKSYWIVCNRSGDILGILDKGRDSKKKNLLTGQQVDAKTFASNNYLWFQLKD